MNPDFDIIKWKIEQITYFKKYLNYFNENSSEYRLLKKGIDELEKSMSN